jgi:hypothetical protein
MTLKKKLLHKELHLHNAEFAQNGMHEDFDSARKEENRFGLQQTLYTPRINTSIEFYF